MTHRLNCLIRTGLVQLFVLSGLLLPCRVSAQQPSPNERVRQIEEQARREPTSEGSTRPYEDLLNHRFGFANDVTGGAGGEVVVINSLNYKDLRDTLESDGPKWIRFKPGLKGEIELEGHLYIKSNKTVDGRGGRYYAYLP